MTHYTNSIRMLFKIDAYDPVSDISMDMGTWHVGNHIPSNCIRIGQDVHDINISTLDGAIAFIMDHIPAQHPMYKKATSSIQWQITLHHVRIRYLGYYIYIDKDPNIIVQPWSYTPTLNDLPTIIADKLHNNTQMMTDFIDSMHILARNAYLDLEHLTTPQALSFESVHPGYRPGRTVVERHSLFFHAFNTKKRPRRRWQVIVPTDIPPIHADISLGVYTPRCEKLEPTLVLLYKYHPALEDIMEDPASLKEAIIQLHNTLPMASAHATLEWIRQWNTPQADASIAAMLSSITTLRTDMESWTNGSTTTPG